MSSNRKGYNLWITFFDVGGVYVYNYNNYMESIYITKLVKIGSSEGVVIPQTILKSYNWQRGDMLVFGFAAPEQLFLKRLTDMEIRRIKGIETIT